MYIKYQLKVVIKYLKCSSWFYLRCIICIKCKVEFEDLLWKKIIKFIIENSLCLLYIEIMIFGVLEYVKCIYYKLYFFFMFLIWVIGKCEFLKLCFVVILMNGFVKLFKQSIIL